MTSKGESQQKISTAYNIMQKFNHAIHSEKLENLVETYVIFITERDVLGKGKPIYHIERVIKETGENFGDEAQLIS